jgi:hypothetical protein
MKEMDEWDNAKGVDEFSCSDGDSHDNLKKKPRLSAS